MVTTLIEQERAAHTTQGSAERTARRYLATMLATCLAIYLLPLLGERVPALQRYAASEWGLILDRSYDLAGTGADLVIFGDSSALYGIDTPRLSGELGIKTINLPQTIGSLAVTGDGPLQRYLAQNKPPRVIVLYVSPWDRDFNAVASARVYEGVEQALRHSTPFELARLLRERSRDLLTFPLSFYRVHSRITGAWVKGGPKTLAPRDGFVPFPAAKAGPLTEPCVLPPAALGVASDRSLRELHAAFERQGTRVINILAPVPHCGGSSVLAAQLGSSLTTLPPSDFAGDGFMVHPLPSHTNETTDRIAELVRASFAQR